MYKTKTGKRGKRVRNGGERRTGGVSRKQRNGNGVTVAMNETIPRIRNNSNRVRKRFKGFPQCLAKYKDHFSFLRDSKFLEDLENDSVDSDIIDEELSALQQVPISKREKVVKFLQSNPVQILLCVIVLLDAGIVIAQILLDLNSVKEKLHRRDIQLSELVAYLRDVHFDKLSGYSGANIDLILRLLRRARHDNTTSSDAPSAPSSNSSAPHTGSLASSNSSEPNPTVTGRQGAPTRNDTLLGWSRGGNASDGVGGADYDVDHAGRGQYPGEAAGGHDSLHDVAHWLHFASISLLGFLVVEDLIKMIAMGWTFCKHKIEIFDAIIISSSFTIDLVFLNGVSGEEGQKAAAILVVLLLWRIARVVDGIVVTVKQRQEFRIRLQKRARRLAERKVETYEEERSTRSKQIEALKDLCSKAGITEADIAACTPRQQSHVTTTLDALSSVAKLSVSMTMLMSSGVYHKPPQAVDGSASLIEDAFDAKSDSHSFSTTQRYHHPPLRIESLPNIQHGGAGGSSTPANERRKAFSSKIRRKRPTVSTTTTTSNDKTRRLSVQESIASTDPPTTTTLTPRGSPVNNCGIRIVIDPSVDVETEVDSLTTATFPTSGLTFCEMDDREVSASNSQMFLLSDMI